MEVKNAIDLYAENNILPIKSIPPLHDKMKTYYSQSGEDGVLEYIFEKIQCKNKYYVEFGAGNGTYISNTAHLRINNGWEGLLLEGNENLVNSVNSNEINLHHEFITSDNINYLFDKYNVPSEYGLLSIDIDGDDAYVFDNLNFEKYSPDVIIIEYNPGLPNHRGIKIKEQKGNLSNGSLHQRGYVGANICELYEIAKRKGYEFVSCISVNLIFIKENLFEKLELNRLSKNTIMAMFTQGGPHELWKNDIIKYNDEWVVSKN